MTYEIYKETEKNLDRIKGSLIGGAAGDALGYTIEFMHEDSIFSKYGKDGITEYKLNSNNKALISDDTQMTLFTATGILLGNTRGALRGIAGDYHDYVRYSYKDWLKTQNMTYSEYKLSEKIGGENFCKYSWLMDLPGLFQRRAPGNACQSAMYSDAYRDIAHPINDSKGCGGIMRVAPLGLFLRYNENTHAPLEIIDREGAEIAAITHGNSLGYMPAAVMTHILTRAVNSYPEMSLKEIIIEARDTVGKIFSGDHHLSKLNKLINLAIELSENNLTDLENIHTLGEGWVAEETLAIAIYCSLKYEHDFSKAIITAVNHNGDSDSTGAVTGNIVGTLVGYENIEEKWKKNLEFRNTILEIATDLCHTCKMEEGVGFRDREWIIKYCECTKPEKYM